MAWHLALMAAPAVMSLATTVFSWLKGRSAKKKLKAQMSQQQAQYAPQLARIQQEMAAYKSMNMGAMGGINNNYMAPSGIGANAYGPAGGGYYPQSFA